MLEIIGSVIALGITIYIFSAGILFLRYLYIIANPDTRKVHYRLKKLLHELKETDNEIEILNKLRIDNEPRKFEILYNNNARIKGDDLYNKKYEENRIDYLKIFEIVKFYMVDISFQKALSSKHKPFLRFLNDEYDKINSDFSEAKIKEKQMINRSKKRYIEYLINENNQDKEYLEGLLKNID